MENKEKKYLDLDGLKHLTDKVIKEIEDNTERIPDGDIIGLFPAEDKTSNS